MEYLDEFDNITTGIDIYNIFKPIYPGDMTHKKEKNTLNLHEVNLKLKLVNGRPEISKKHLTQADYTPWAFRGGKKSSRKLRDPDTYLNDPAVRTALHIPETVQAYSGCISNPAWNYTMFEKGSQWIWEDLKGKYRMLKFSGDIDACVPTDGSLGWILALNRTVVKPWRQYQVGDQVGGWIEEFDGLTFATVNGAGHMVPQDKPAEAFHLIFNWLNNTAI